MNFTIHSRKLDRDFDFYAPDGGGREELRQPESGGFIRASRYESDRRSAGWPGREKPAEDYWQTEPDVGRVADGVPDRVARLKALGNAVVPQCAEVVGHIVLELEARRSKAGK